MKELSRMGYIKATFAGQNNYTGRGAVVLAISCSRIIIAQAPCRDFTLFGLHFALRAGVEHPIEGKALK